MELKARQGIRPAARRLKFSENCVQRVINLQWNFSINSVAICNDLWQMVKSTSLLPRLCFMSNISWSFCTHLNQTMFIETDLISLSFSIFNDSILNYLFPAHWNGMLWVWLDVNAKLWNGSHLLIKSKKLDIGNSVTCSSPVTGK